MTRNIRPARKGRPEKYRRELHIRRIKTIKEDVPTKSFEDKIGDDYEPTHHTTIVTPPAERGVEQKETLSSPLEKKRKF